MLNGKYKHTLTLYRKCDNKVLYLSICLQTHQLIHLLCLKNAMVEHTKSFFCT